MEARPENPDDAQRDKESPGRAGATYSSVLNNAQDAARKVGLSLVPIEARNSQEIEDAFPRARILCSGDLAE